MNKIMEEVRHFCNALMDFDLSDFEVRRIPETSARLEQKLLSMDMTSEMVG